MLSSDLLVALDTALSSPTAVALYVVFGVIIAAAMILVGIVMIWDDWHAGRHIGRHRPPHGRKAVAR